MEKGRKKCPLSFGRERGSKWRNFIVLRQNKIRGSITTAPPKQTNSQTNNKPIKVSGLCCVDRRGHIKQGSYTTLNTREMNKMKINRFTQSYCKISEKEFHHIPNKEKSHYSRKTARKQKKAVIQQ